MAPTPRSSAAGKDATGEKGKIDPFKQWLLTHGTAEYASYKREAAAPHLTSEDWAASEHPLGPFLYHLALDAWEADSSTDEEIAQSVESASHGKAGKKRNFIAKTNGHGVSQTDSTNGAVLEAPSRESSPTTKRKRRPRKKYISEEIIRSDEDEASTPAPDPDLEEPVEYIKKGTPKVKTAIDPYASVQPTKKSPSIVANSSSNGANAASDEASASRRGLRVRTPAQQRPYLHHAKLFDELEDEGGAATGIDRPPQKPKSRLSEVYYAQSEDAVSDDDTNVDFDDFPIEPEPEPEPAPGPRKFKGKGRAWQKTNEDEDDDYRQVPSYKKPKKKGRPRKSLPLHNRPLPETSLPESVAQPKAEPERIVVDDPPAEPAKEKRRRSGPRKTVLSQEFVRSESDTEGGASGVEESIVVDDTPLLVNDSPSTERKEEEKRKRRPRKPYLSLEFVDDDTDTDDAEAAAAYEEASRAHMANLGTSVSVERTLDKSGLTRATVSGPSLKDAPKPRMRKGKSHLSEEFIRDDSDSDEDEEDGGEVIAITPSPEKTKNTSLVYSDSPKSHRQQLSAKKHTPKRKSAAIIRSEDETDDDE